MNSNLHISGIIHVFTGESISLLFRRICGTLLDFIVNYRNTKTVVNEITHFFIYEIISNLVTEFSKRISMDTRECLNVISC